MNCGDCGTPLVCPACHGVIVSTTPRDADPAQTPGPGLSSNPEDAHSVFLIVARGHHSLYEQLRSLVGELGRVQVIEDRRRDQTLLPREGREGAPL